MCTQRNAWNACGARAADACMLFACSVSRRAMEHGARDEYQRHRQDGRAAGARGVQWVQRCMVLCTESCQDARGRAWPCVATRRLHVTCEAERMGAASGGKPSAPNQVRPSRRMCALATRVQYGRVCTHAAATLALRFRKTALRFWKTALRFRITALKFRKTALRFRETARYQMI